MNLTVYNTFTRRQEPFRTIEPGKVKMYCCGVTVYDYCHLGHARSYIIWDTIRQYLKWRGYEVRYIQNFTDIDDKILNRARETSSTMTLVANRFIDEYFVDMHRLNVKDADEYPRVTEYIFEIQQLIQDLQKKDFAYATDGNVYYRVESFPNYGKLSGRRLDDMKSGASGRVDTKNGKFTKKQHPFDFALWKSAKPGEPAWDSPWGRGRPGWHIECSAMIHSSLGSAIDIHGGGSDLIFPHHENEIAQSEAAMNEPLARYWTHNGMVMVDGQKMSKSLLNFITIRDLLDGKWFMHPQPVDPMAVRLFILQAHYRKPLDFTSEAIITAENSWNNLKDALLFGPRYGERFAWQTTSSSLITEVVEKFQISGDDDFNFSGSLAVLFELAKELRREANILVHEGSTQKSSVELYSQWQTLVSLAHVLGLDAIPEEKSHNTDTLSTSEIEVLIQKRYEARKNKNFLESDRIRNQLKEQGINLVDGRDGTRWYRG